MRMIGRWSTRLSSVASARRSTASSSSGSVVLDLVCSWHVGLANWKDSGILAWPVRMVSAIPTAPVDMVKFDYTVKEPTVLSILSWAGITGRACEWQSWGTQVRSTPNIGKHQVRELHIYTTTAHHYPKPSPHPTLADPSPPPPLAPNRWWCKFVVPRSGPRHQDDCSWWRAYHGQASR